MAEGEGGMNVKKMPKATPDIEWSTREKLAVASYVKRNGEQNWSGAGRVLRPLGEPGRPSDWFSPKFCAQQYTALMDQVPTPKRKRSESTENVQPAVSSEEAIINRLTKERIEELKKLVRNERAEYRKMKREFEMIENGELDDKLDELLRDAKKDNAVGVEDTLPMQTNIQATTSSKDMVQNTEPVQPTAAEGMTAVETEERPSECEQSVEVDVDNTENISNKMSTETSAALAEEAVDGGNMLESSDTQPVTEVTDILSKELNINKKNERVEVTPTATYTSVERSSANDENVFPESALMKAEELMKASDTIPVIESVTATQNSSDMAVNPVEPEQTFPIPDDMETEVANNERKTDVCEDAALKIKSENTCKIEEPASEMMEQTHVDNTEKSPMEEEVKITPSLPSTPGQTGSFVYDSTFPYSPALSHSSDMDPESTASTKAWRKSIMILWKQVASHRYANIFLQPVTDEIAPNYSNTVYRSADLATIKKNIEGGAIKTTSEFRRDMMLMFQNALMYNNAEHDVYRWTLEMQEDFIVQIAQFIATQMIIETAQTPENKSLRRSTMRRSVLSEKSGQSTRSRRSAALESDSK